MSNTNRDYLIVCEVKNSKITIARQLNFYITDKNTSNIFIKLVNRIENDDGISSYVDIENSTAYNVTLRIVKPNNETMSVAATQLEAEAIYQVDLGENCKNIAGPYKCELLITTTVNGREELNTSDPFTYLVKNSILSNVGEIVESGGVTTEKILNDLDAIKARIKDIANNFTTEQTDSSFIIKYESKVIAEIPLNATPNVYGNIVVDVTNLEITEGGAGTFTVKLDQAPTKNQNINIISDNSKVTVNPSTLTFTPSNYNTTQTVTVSAEDDTIEENGYTLTLTLSSNNVSNVIINITVNDNDVNITYNPVVAPLTDYTYTKIGNNVYLEKYNGTQEDILVPATYESDGATCGVYLHSRNNTIFPTGVRYVKFADGVQDYQNTNFASSFKDNTTFVKAENIPESAHSWGYAFYGCTALKSIIPINSNVTNIQRTYYGCTSLVNASNFEIPSGCSDASETFAGCTALEDGGKIPSHISSLTRTYYNCNSLKKIIIESKTLTGLDINSGFLTKITNKLTIHGYLDSAIFTELKGIVCAQNGRKNIFFKSLTSDNQINISCFGDSLTAGQNVTPNYPTALDALLPSNSLVYCYGNGGYTLEQISGVMDNYTERLINDIVIIWGGTNSSTATASVDAYKEYVKTMIAKLQTDKYIIMTPVYAKYNAEYDTAFATEFGNHYFSLRNWFDSNSYIVANYVTDGTHFNADGNRLIATAIKEKLLSLGYINNEN